MNSTLDYIPTNDGKFLEWVTFLFAYLNVHAETWKIDPETYAEINKLIDVYAAAYKRSEDPNRGKADVKAKNDSRDALKKAVRKYVKEYLSNNHLISDEEHERMGLPVHKTTRTPAPVATDAPWTKARTDVLRHLTFDYGGSETSKAKPKGQHGLELSWIIADEKPVHVDALTRSAFDTHSPLTIEFDEADRGKTLWYAARWENTRGEKGPWSEILRAIIP
jgi:hypothetical protein